MHGFGFAFWAGGRAPRFHSQALEILNEGIGRAYLGSRKHFNQNYRSSGSVQWYLTAP